MTVERSIFGSGDVGATVARFVRDELGSEVQARLFERTSVGVVLGLELVDGRRVVVKAHQPCQSVEFLRAVFETQGQLLAGGFPCPRPLLPATPIGQAFATVEELVDAGSFRDAHEASVRQEMARALGRLLDLTRPLGRPAALRRTWSLWAGDQLWPPTAHSPIFDFEATASGAEWIDELAAEAKSRSGGGEELVAHSDWSGKHFRFDTAGEITVVYDWDSLALRTEVQAVGTAAATFTANFELDVDYSPTPDEVASFVEEYSAARVRPLSDEDVAVAHAVAMYVMAYAARCEHALGERGDFARALDRHGDGYLSS
jgi:hypothetical protein